MHLQSLFVGICSKNSCTEFKCKKILNSQNTFNTTITIKSNSRIWTQYSNRNIFNLFGFLLFYKDSKWFPYLHAKNHLWKISHWNLTLIRRIIQNSSNFQKSNLQKESQEKMTATSGHVFPHTTQSNRTKKNISKAFCQFNVTSVMFFVKLPRAHKLQLSSFSFCYNFISTLLFHIFSNFIFW